MANCNSNGLSRVLEGAQRRITSAKPSRVRAVELGSAKQEVRARTVRLVQSRSDDGTIARDVRTQCTYRLLEV